MNVATKQMHAPKAEDDAPSVYAPAAQTAQLLARSQAWRNARLNQADMINTEDAAQLAGTNRETINRWIGTAAASGWHGRCAATGCRAGSSSRRCSRICRPSRRRWAPPTVWARHGSPRYIDTNESMRAAVDYVQRHQ